MKEVPHESKSPYGTEFMLEGRVLIRHMKQQNYLEHQVQL
ncbi:hypothetical protein ABIC12_003508 [Pantoea agglomerans]|jgi:type VI secretion system protein